jgi:23S rRNA (cytosine1962-C5)-methyltransferase
MSQETRPRAECRLPSRMPRRPSPEAIPFSRGRPAPRAASAAGKWIDAATWHALRTQGTDAHRLATGRDWWLERFGSDLLLSHQTEAGRTQAQAELAAHGGDYDFKVERLFGKYLPQQAAERGAPKLLQGDAALSVETTVREAGVNFGLDFAAGYSAGFFIDQRENRAHVRRLAPGRMLNTFAYTCSFSVVAALAGAETFSIDLSRRSLTRGEENFSRNGLEPRGGAHRFITDDVLAVLPRLARRGEKFDAIILDPPTFSRNQAGESWQVLRDFEELVALALDVAAPRAHVLLSVNHSSVRVADLERFGRGALRMRGRSGRFFSTRALADFPAGEGARTIWLELAN